MHDATDVPSRDDRRAFMSRDTDRGRLAYGLTRTDAKRQCIIVGTTNSEAYLRDLTGNRRFWPVLTKAFDIEALKRDRDQLWAEAEQREAAGASIRLPECLWEVARHEQKKRVVTNSFVSVLDHRYEAQI
jgi:predicted P-loop ATPase